MFGTTHRATERQPERRYYKCAGKDPIFSARGHICTRRTVTCAELEAAVWGHIVALLQEPARLLAQFQHQARLATEGTEAERAEAERLRARLERLKREEARLLDAYQAGVIELAELAERRDQVAQRRRAVDEQRAQAERLRRERAQAEAVLADLTAFCARVRGRLAEATFDDKQAILQLLIERIIVHDDRLEIRHVIPLRSAPDGPTTPGPPDVRLRSDGMDPAALPARAVQDGRRSPPSGRAWASLITSCTPRQPARHQPAQEGLPEGAVLARPDVQPQHLALAASPSRPIAMHHRHRHAPARAGGPSRRWRRARRRGSGPASGRVRKRSTSSSRLWHRRDDLALADALHAQRLDQRRPPARVLTPWT